MVFLASIQTHKFCVCTCLKNTNVGVCEPFLLSSFDPSSPTPSSFNGLYTRLFFSSNLFRMACSMASGSLASIPSNNFSTSGSQLALSRKIWNIFSFAAAAAAALPPLVSDAFSSSLSTFTPFVAYFSSFVRRCCKVVVKSSRRSFRLFDLLKSFSLFSSSSSSTRIKHLVVVVTMEEQ